jgi:hypothetical protein
MSTTSDLPYPYQPGNLAPAAGPKDSRASGLLVSLAVLIGGALIGLVGGFVWAQVAPRAVYVVVSRGSADVVNPETTAFIAGDAWYCLIGMIGGLLIGVAGYLLAVRRYGPVPMVAVLAASILAAFVARVVGQNWGLSRFDSQLLTSHQGTLLHAPLVLGGGTSAVLWPAIASWPFGACLMAGALVLFLALRGPEPTQPKTW